MPLCECGCGEMCRNRFVQGHNAKRGVGGSLRSRILQKITINSNGCWEWEGAVKHFADKFGVSISTVSKIRTGHNWAWV